MSLLGVVSTELQLDSDFIRKVALGASYRYKRYTVPKRSGGVREIFHPARELKALQRWLLVRLVGTWPVHSAATAYGPGCSIRANALAHAAYRYTTRLDFRDFFPSLSPEDFLLYAADRLGDSGLSAPDLALIQRICFRHGQLTIGAPTSPALSNALCITLDSEITRICTSAEVVYTRYADDVFLSCNQPGLLNDIVRDVSGLLRTVPYPRGLFLNEAKTRHLSRKRHRSVTGVVVTTDGTVSLGRDAKRRLRSRIFKWDSLPAQERRSVAGYLAFALSVEPGLRVSLDCKYGVDRIAMILRGA